MSLADELSAAARRASDRLAQNIQESVPWDVNTQTAQARRVPLRFEIAGVTLEIAQSSVALAEPGAPQSGTGSVVWTAAVGLARYLEHAESLDGKRVLELGAGTALVSLAAAALGADAVATDIPACVAGVTAPNIAANRGRVRGACEARELVWGETELEPQFGRGAGWWDLVVASDVVYRAEQVPPLVATLQGVVGPGRRALIAFERRGRAGNDAFLKALAAAGFAVREVDAAVEMPVGFRFVHFGLVELVRRGEGDG